MPGPKQRGSGPRLGGDGAEPGRSQAGKWQKEGKEEGDKVEPLHEMEGRNPGPAGIRDCMQYQEGTGELLCWVRSKQAERGEQEKGGRLHMCTGKGGRRAWS